MNFTFGITTNGLSTDLINNTIRSIYVLNIPNFEIIIIGGQNNYSNDIIHIPFNENNNKGWITKKKNLICLNAKYENIVLLHDYIEFCDDWYKGFLDYGNDFDICVTKIINKNGSRFRDYTLFPYGVSYPFDTRGLIPYNYNPSLKLSKLMYISGAYYIIKKNIALTYLLDERLMWGQGEDVELSKRLVNNGIILKCNYYSTVKFQKDKVSGTWEIEMTADDLTYFENLSDEQINKLTLGQMNNLKNYIYTTSSIKL